MTTAHRPTWNAAVGSSNEGGWTSGGAVSTAFSARDLPGHTKLKLRQPGQGTADDVAGIDLKQQLEEKEQKALFDRQREKEAEKKGGVLQRNHLDEKEPQLLLLKNAETKDVMNVLKKYEDDDEDEDDDAPHKGGSDSEESSSDSDDEDDEEELLRELEKIKREREEERLRKEQEEEELMKKAAQQSALVGNPLLATSGGSATLKRRWNDDTVFKNQARGETETRKRFINDTIRNDFHRRFLTKYIQ